MSYVHLNQEIKVRVRNLRRRQTRAEVMLWERLRARRFIGLKFLRQHPIIFHENGRNYYFIADFYCNEFGLVIELDGAIHHIQKEYDEMRDIVVRGIGLEVLRINNIDVYHNIDQVLYRVQGLILERKKLT